MGKYLNQLSFLMLSKEEASYNAPFKEQFKRVGKKAMMEFADLLELKQVDIHFNQGGIAVSGDLILMGMWSEGDGIYVSMNKDFPNKPWGDVLFRTIKHMKDFTGGSNNYFRFELLRFPEALKQRVLTLKKGGQTDGREWEQREREEEREERKPDDYAHQNV
jgi:hypothetical protein